MKRLLKRGLKAVWRSTEPLRRPILRKLELFLRRCLLPTEQSLHHETDVLMDHVVRELVRLQLQVEALQQILLDVLPAQPQTQDLPAIAGEIEPADGRTADEKLKAG